MFAANHSFWVLAYYRGTPDMVMLGAYQTVVRSFFWMNWLVGWIPAGAMIVDMMLEYPFGTGSKGLPGGMHTILIIYTIAEWGVIALLGTFIKDAFEAYFIKHRVTLAHKVLQKAGLEKKPKKLKSALKLKKADGFNDDWN